MKPATLSKRTITLTTLMIYWLAANFPNGIISEGTSGEKALEIVQQTPPHIILMIIILPHIR
jgi:YesN/AraC family two-component response regulator